MSTASLTNYYNLNHLRITISRLYYDNVAATDTLSIILNHDSTNLFLSKSLSFNFSTKIFDSIEFFNLRTLKIRTKSVRSVIGKKKKEKFYEIFVYIYQSRKRLYPPPHGSARWLEGLVGLRRGKTGRVKVRQGMFPRNYAKLHPPVAL